MILKDVDNLIQEINLKHLAIGAGATALVSLFTLAGLAGLPLIVILSKTILKYLLFSIFVTGGVGLSLLSAEKIDMVVNIDKFLSDNFDRLKSNGYNNIEQIQKKSISARDNILSKCKEETKYTEQKYTFIVPKLLCAKKALIEYMKVCLVELNIYYLKLLNQSISNISSLEVILSFKEEAPFNLVLNKITNRFIKILELLQEDTKSFKSQVLESIKQSSKPNIPEQKQIPYNKPPEQKLNRPPFQQNRPFNNNRNEHFKR